MEYKDERTGEIKSTNYLVLIDGETSYRIEKEHDGIVITKIDFDNDIISIKPKVRNQIAIS